MKMIISLGLAVLLGAGILAFVLGNYYLVRTEDGFHLIGKEGFSLEETVVDTRDWSPVDWLKNKEISMGLTKVKWEEFKGKAAKRWENFSKNLEKELNDLDLDDTSDKAKKKIDDVRKATRRKYEELVKRLEKEEITWENFQKKMDELNKWAAAEIEKIKKKLN